MAQACCLYANVEETGWWGIGEQVRGRYGISNTAESPVAAGGWQEAADAGARGGSHHLPERREHRRVTLKQ